MPSVSSSARGLPLDVDRLRDWLKSGPLQRPFAELRRLKRWLRSEPLGGALPQPPVAMSLAELLQAASTVPDTARVCYSLGLAWLNTDASAPGAAQRALACLRTAQCYEFEAAERLALYTALAFSRCGALATAQAACASLLARDLTAEEDALRVRVLAGSEPAVPVASRALAPLRAAVEARAPESLLVIGDALAESATWCVEARYALLCAEVTGVSFASLAQRGGHFALGLSTPAARKLAEKAGLSCDTWFSIAEPYA